MNAINPQKNILIRLYKLLKSQLTDTFPLDNEKDVNPKNLYRLWLKTKSEVQNEIYKKKRNQVNMEIKIAKRNDVQSKID